MGSGTSAFPELKGYRFDRLLGSGGMGSVYLAEDETLGRRVAIKALAEELEEGSEAESRFIREARSMATIEHPNVVRVYAFATEGRRTFIVMEHVEGETLAERLKHRGPLPLGEALKITRQVVEALEAAWEKGVVHRDIKPSNILIDRRGRVRVADFSLAKAVQEDQSSSLTLEGTLQGTPYYMAPEQARNQPVDWRSDIYSLGAVLHEMLSGERPFRGSLFKIVHHHLHDPFPALGPEIPAEVASFVGWLAQKDPEDRPTSYPELMAVLDRLIRTQQEDDETLAATIDSDVLRIRRPNRMRRAGVGVVLVLLLVLAITYLEQHRLQPSPGPNPFVIRRSVAVLGFRNVTERSEVAWLSVALSEMLSAELAAGGRFRVISGENVARAKIELALEEGESLAPDRLKRVRTLLGADLVVLGSYQVDDDGERLEITVNIQDTEIGAGVATVSSTRTVTEVIDLLPDLAQQLNRELGADIPESALGRAGLPSDPEALRFYAEGLSYLRQYKLTLARDRLSEAIAAEPDQPLVHSAMASVWAELGNDRNAQEAAKTALELAVDVSREDHTFVEGRYYELSGRWDEAIERYRTIYEFFPDNIDYGLHLADVLTSGGHGEEAIGVLDSLRRLPAPTSQDVRIDLGEVRAEAALGDWQRALETARRATARAESQGARLLAAQARLLQGTPLLRLGQHDEIGSLMETAREVFEEVGDQGREAYALNVEAEVAFRRGDFRQALGLYEAAADHWRSLGDRSGLAASLNNLANTHMMLGALSAALPLIRSSIAISSEIRSRHEPMARVSFAELSLRMGDLTTARREARTGLRQSQALRHLYGEESALHLLGWIALLAGEVETARDLLNQGLGLAREKGDRVYTSAFVFMLGHLSMLSDQLDSARRHFEEVLEIQEQMGNDDYHVADGHVALARLSLEEGKLGDPFSELGPGLREVIVLFAERGLRDREAGAWAVLAMVALASGRNNDARQACRLAENRIRQSEDLLTRLRVAIWIARVWSGLGSAETAKASLGGIVDEARRQGFVELEYEARLALLDLETADPAARRRLAEEAAARHLLRIARLATANL